MAKLTLASDRYFGPEARQKEIARQLYRDVAGLPLVCPHGHVDPRLFADPDYSFGTPTELLILPDHYVFRMLYSLGISLESLGLPRRDQGPVETDHRKIWQVFADHFYLFRGTPTSLWLNHELHDIFGVQEKLTSASAQRIYDHIAAQLARPEFRPRALFERFNIEVLCTTDAATDTLEYHRAIRASGWRGRLVPTFRPDALVNLDDPGWRENIRSLSKVSGINVTGYLSYIQALEQRRAYFKEYGARATDHAVLTLSIEKLTDQEAGAIFQRALHRKATPADAQRFSGHMLMEMARMSTEDGLVMQMHPGSLRNHNDFVFARFGLDKGADIPVATEYTRSLWPLLNRYGTDTRLTLILFTLDESTYTRELAPLAGLYPAVKLGPPWWFHDSLNGMARYFDQVMETAGLYNTVGFNDDTRAFCSIPARHDVWRRAAANWIAGLFVRGMVDMDDAVEMVTDLAYRLARRAYNLEDEPKQAGNCPASPENAQMPTVKET
ncbi:MAG: glucuronate isomerase [Chloroflexi bacterium]|nr:glucuronate isomerase [Chloroflexota bacterium]